MPAPDPVHITIHPEPTPEELAVILAAYRELWPSPAPSVPPAPPQSLRWRFSGRWWHQSPMRGQRNH
jgi:hypothetical protein